MMYVLSSRLIRASVACAAALFAASGACAQSEVVKSEVVKSEVSKSGPTQVSAVYQIALNGFDVGSFRYTSWSSGSLYKLTSDVDLSLLMGAFRWKGVSRTSGLVTASAVKPAAFDFNYSSTLKNGSLRMGFAKGSVETIAIDPPSPPVADAIALKPEHLANVLDPLSAILALTQNTGGQPCDRRVAIFDGKQRFDLQLIYRRTEAAAATADGGAEPVSVCRVKYIPIAGYRQTEETTNLSRTTGIEISFKAVPGAKLFVPQKIVLPTLAGNAEITVQRVDINTPSNGQVALVND